ncbi:MAG: sugar phosphate isomerase/epimerase [Erysipelotrichaceae bacterium]|nr:sugar phosphate isomerase/epimerase [Erysipelotrichaceae bacterium]
MKIGVFSKVYVRDSCEEAFSDIARDGIHDVQFNFETIRKDPLPEHVEEELLDRINECAEKYSIRIDALSGTFNMIDPDPDRKEKAIRQFEYQCYLAHRLHAPVITLCTGSKNENKWKWDDRNLEEASYRELLETTRIILEFAHKYGIVLGVEPEPTNVINDAHKARRYLDDIADEHLKIVMDGANLFTEKNIDRIDEVLKESFSLLGKDVCLAHGKDLYIENRKTVYTGSGMGKIDFPLFVSLLIEYGYEGPIIMHGLKEEDVVTCRNYLEGVMDGKLC